MASSVQTRKKRLRVLTMLKTAIIRVSAVVIMVSTNRSQGLFVTMIWVEEGNHGMGQEEPFPLCCGDEEGLTEWKGWIKPKINKWINEPKIVMLTIIILKRKCRFIELAHFVILSFWMLLMSFFFLFDPRTECWTNTEKKEYLSN